MASAPQSFGRSDLSGLGLLYVAPEDGPNILAAGLSGYLGQRIPTARAIFAKRLAALDPTAQQAAKLKIAEERGKLLSAMAANDRMAAKISSDKSLSYDESLRVRAQMLMADRKNQTDLAVARTQQDTELIKSSTLDQARPMADALDSAIRAHELALSQGADPVESVDQLVRELESINEAAANLPAQQKIALQQHAQDQIRGLRIQDPAMLDMTAQAISGELDVPTRFEATRHGVGASPDFAELLGEVKGAYDEQGIPMPGSTGSSVSVSRGQGVSGRAPPVPLDASPGPTSGRGGTGGGGSGGGGLGAGMTYLDQLRAQLEQQAAADPFGGLGGFNDPLPGMGRDRPPKEGRVERLAEKRPQRFQKLAKKVKPSKDGKRAQRQEPTEDVDQIEAQGQPETGESLSPEKERAPRTKGPGAARQKSAGVPDTGALLDELLPPQSDQDDETQRIIDEALPPQTPDNFDELLPPTSQVEPTAPPQVTDAAVTSLKKNLDPERARGLLFPPRAMSTAEKNKLRQAMGHAPVQEEPEEDGLQALLAQRAASDSGESRVIEQMKRDQAAEMGEFAELLADEEPEPGVATQPAKAMTYAERLRLAEAEDDEEDDEEED